MPDYALLLLAAVAAGWVVQLFMSYRQSMAFNAEVHRLKRSGTVSVGSGGRRYRGGRAFVAVAVDEYGVARDAISLSGFTTFARARKLPALIGVRASTMRGDAAIPGLTRPQRAAARQAAILMRAEMKASRQSSDPSRDRTDLEVR